MSQTKTLQRFVYKIHSGRLRRAGWNLELPLHRARENKELIALNDSQLLRFIDRINKTGTPEIHIAGIRSQIEGLKRQTDLRRARPEIKKLYEELDRYLFQKDYVCVVMDSVKDYRYLCKKGFRINSVTYGRLLGTTGGVKNNTIVFVNERLLPELKKRIANGRALSKPFIPAKLEAYNALVCTSSVPVSLPRGIVVVHDCITHFKSDVIELDDTNLAQPRMKYIKDKDIRLNDSDGYGIAMPALMERWGHELGKDYILPGCVIRNAFCKGCVFPVDFQKFARDHQVHCITDVWGNSYDIQNIELVLTESMLKLWDSYSSLEEYLSCCMENQYTFSIAKTSDKELEDIRTMNYQFLQSYDFSDEQIEELIAPTVREIKAILSEDYRKAILFAKGTKLHEDNLLSADNPFASALMIEPEMINDPYIRTQLYTMIRKRIDHAKVGGIKVPANYSFVSGDPYSLCQSMFGLKVTGLLKAGEIYSKYWLDQGADKIVSFRAPMTCHNNIRLLKVVSDERMADFYQYMTTPTIFNSWDTCADAMNGFDKDGDCVLNTALPLLVNNTRNLPAIVCVQRKAPACVPSEEDLIQSNINSFGNSVGEVTNRITSMFETQAAFKKGSRAYRILDYRIKCGQLYQQNQIDKTKGIEAKDMPAQWFSKTANKIGSGKNSSEKKQYWLGQQLVSDRKPYFMQYIYPADKKKYKDYLTKNDEKCMMLFRCSLNELLAKKDRSPGEEAFLKYYHKNMPLGAAPCTVNKICRRMESLFDDVKPYRQKNFDYSILKCGAGYTGQTYDKIKKLYNEYVRELAGFMQYAKSERIKSEERQMQKYILKEEFKRRCLKQCPDEGQLCDIVLDLCYAKSQSSKQFAWDICGGIFLENLLKKNNYTLEYPVPDEHGDILFNGKTFSMKKIKIKE